MAAGYFRLADFQRAGQAARRGLVIDHKSAEAHHLLALVQTRLGDVAKATVSFHRALRLGGSSRTWNNYGTFMYNQKQYVKACRALSRAAANSGYEGRATAFENLGHCYLQLAKPQAAEQAFHRAARLDTQAASPWLELAAIAQTESRCAEAQQHYRAFLQRSEQTAASLLVGIFIARTCETLDYQRLADELKTQYPTFWRRYRASIGY